MSNIDDFDAIAGIVFTKLYESFPIPTEIHSLAVVSEAFGEPKAHVSTPEEIAAYHQRAWEGEQTPEEMEDRKRSEVLYEVFAGAMDWLCEEGFIRKKGSDGLIYTDVVLTLKGLQALSIVPSGIQSPIGQQMVEAAKKGSLDGLRDLTKKAISNWGPAAVQLLFQLLANKG